LSFFFIYFIIFLISILTYYLQIELPEEDRHVHRFLWRNLELTKKPTIYALQRVTFGDKPSPDMASFVMLKMAKDNEEDNQCVYPSANSFF